MHFATPVRTWRVARLCSVLYSVIALSRNPFGIGHMYIYIFFFLLRMTDTMTSQNIDISSWDILYKQNDKLIINVEFLQLKATVKGKPCRFMQKIKAPSFPNLGR
jgi:hypothetical protein